MRTTLTIDDDVEALLKQRLRASGEPLKHAVNKYLRLGMLAEEKRETAKQQPIKLRNGAIRLAKVLSYRLHVGTPGEA